MKRTTNNFDNSNNYHAYIHEIANDSYFMDNTVCVYNQDDIEKIANGEATNLKVYTANKRDTEKDTELINEAIRVSINQNDKLIVTVNVKNTKPYFCIRSNNFNRDCERYFLEIAYNRQLNTIVLELPDAA